MWVEVTIFIISLAFSGIIIYILGLLWFGDTRNRRTRSFFALGVFVTFWTLLNAIAIITAERFFPFIYTLRIAFVCIIPFSVSWFILNFTRLKIVRYRFFQILIWSFPILDALFMLTNPLHHIMFLDYNYPVPARNLGFWIHFALGFLVVLPSFVVLLRYVFKHARNEPLVIVAGFGTFIPYILNILYSFGFRYIPYDITPLGFFITFMLFAVSSYRSQLFNMKALTLSKIYTLLKEVILIINEQGIIVDASPATAENFPDFSLSAGHSSIKDFFSYLKEYSAECSPENLLDPKLQGWVEREGELRLRRETDKDATYTITLKTIMAKKRPSGYIFIMFDVSAYRSMISEINVKNARLAELREAAEAASMAKSAFLANMSHEIRTPLNAVMGMALVARKSTKDEKALAAIGEIETASKHLLGVLNNVLDMSKIESGKFELIHEIFSLHTAMKEVAELINQRCEEKNIHLESRFEYHENLEIIGDKLRLKQILINLLGNAIKFTPEKGTIIFDIRVMEGTAKKVKIHFRIEDNGIGIEEEELGKLFKAFSQANTNTFNRFGGTGLGLSISQNLTRMMGGEISVKSKAGKGSSFEFSLDFPKPGKTTVHKKESNEIIPDLSGKRILLAEDVEINRIIIAELLEETKLAIEEARDGQAAVNAFKEKPPYYYDLVFMDVQMPIMDGYEATRLIRAIEAAKGFRQIPIIAMTANAYKEDIEKALDSGMNGHLSKPIDIGAVMQVLAEKLV